MSLRGQVALITGASSGIGEAIAEELAARGMRLALAARRTDRLDAVVTRLATTHQTEALAIACDVREPAQVEAAVSTTLSHFGALDALIANAGFGYRSPVVDGDIARWKSMFDTNFFGLLVTLKHGVKPMLDRGRGHVVVTSSVAGRVVTPGGGAYCASKFAATAMAEALRMEVGPRGIQVTTIEPGIVISEFQAVADYTPDIVANMLKGTEPLMPADIARAVAFALEQPAHVGINEIVVRPTGQAQP